MNLDSHVIDLDDMEQQDAEDHLSAHDALQLGLNAVPRRSTGCGGRVAGSMSSEPARQRAGCRPTGRVHQRRSITTCMRLVFEPCLMW